MTAGEVNRNYGGVVGLYHLEDVNDSSGTAATLSNVNTVTFTPAKFNNGANFGAANSNKYLLSTSAMTIDGGAITMMGWFKLNAEIGSGNWVFSGQTNSVSKVANEFRYDYNAGARALTFVREKRGVAAQEASYTVAFGTEKFFHLAYIYDGTTLRGYHNSNLVASVAASGSGSTASNDCGYIGARKNDGGAASNFSSIMADEVVFLNRALSHSELKNYYAWAKGLRVSTP